MTNNDELRKVLDSDDLPRAEVRTPEWPDFDGKLFVRTPTILEYAQTLRVEDDAMRVVLMIISCVIDRDGAAIFRRGDEGKLLKRNAEPIMRLYNEIGRLSNLGAGAIEERAKKNAAMLVGDSCSA